MFLSLFIIVVEIVLITALNYSMKSSHISIDVLYCLPIIQAASAKSLLAKRKTDSALPYLLGFVVAFAWSFSEYLVAPEDISITALALNVFTRGITFAILGRVVSRLWHEREYGQKDFLTNLANRPNWIDKLEQEQLRSERSRQPYSLLYIDIDRFKKLNDTHGHKVGDAALKQVADILTQGSRKTNSIARIGGDEFAVLAPETGAQECAILMQRINELAEQTFVECGWDISLSIGHITYIGQGKTVTELLHEADSNMYQVKKSKQ